MKRNWKYHLTEAQKYTIDVFHLPIHDAPSPIRSTSLLQQCPHPDTLLLCKITAASRSSSRSRQRCQLLQLTRHLWLCSANAGTRSQLGSAEGGKEVTQPQGGSKLPLPPRPFPSAHPCSQREVEGRDRLSSAGLDGCRVRRAREPIRCTDPEGAKD